MPIVSHLGSKEPSLLGDSPLEKALVRQWVNFQVIIVIINGYRLLRAGGNEFCHFRMCKLFLPF